MTKTTILIACLALVPAAFAQTPGSEDIKNTKVLSVTSSVAPGAPTYAGIANAPSTAEAQQIIASVSSDVTVVEIADLLEKIASVTSGKDRTTQTLLSIQGELTRQTGAFKKAHASAASGANQDVDQLFAQVIEDKAGSDTSRLERVAATYEALLTQFGQLVTSRFLASSATGIPTIGSDSHAEAAAVAQAASQRSSAYEANVNRAAGELRELLALK